MRYPGVPNLVESLTSFQIFTGRDIYLPLTYCIFCLLGPLHITHCVKSVQIRRFSGPYFPVFSPNTGKYRPEKTTYLDTFHAVTCNGAKIALHKNFPLRISSVNVTKSAVSCGFDHIYCINP